MSDENLKQIKFLKNELKIVEQRGRNIKRNIIMFKYKYDRTVEEIKSLKDQINILLKIIKEQPILEEM